MSDPLTPTEFLLTIVVAIAFIAFLILSIWGVIYAIFESVYGWDSRGAKPRSSSKK